MRNFPNSPRRHERAAWPLVVGLGLVTLLSVERTAWAQTEDERAGARVAATDGVGAFNEQRWSDAADLFSRAESLVHSPVHVLYLARAQAKLGRFVKARENYNKIVREKFAADAPEAFRKAQASAQQEVGLIEPKIAAIAVNLSGAGPQQVTVTMDGEKIPPALIGLQRPVDPGKHEFQASGDGLQSDVASVTVTEGGHESVTLAVKSVAGAKPAGGPAAVPAVVANPTLTLNPETGAAPADAGSSSSPKGRPGLRVPGYIALGVGAVGVGVGTVFLLKSKSSRSKADDLCPNDQCPVSKQSQVNSFDNDANSASTLAIVGFAAGGVGLATGITLLVMSRGSGSAAQGSEPSLRPWVGLNQAGIMGRF